jgi:BatD DUF11 like domain
VSGSYFLTRSRLAGFVPLLVLAGSLVGSASAAVQVGAELDRDEVSLGEQVVLTVTVNGEARDVREPRIPAVDGIEVYGGGQSQRFSFVNGQVSAVHSFTFYLRPLREGSFSVAPIEVEVDGRMTPVRAVSFRVHKGNAPPSTAGRGSGSTPAVGDADVFVMLTVDQDSVVVGEQVIMTFGYYRATRASAFDSPQYTPPRTEGFWREDLPPERRTTRVIRSRRYNVTEIRYALFPTRAGDLEIGSAELRLAEDVFGSFFRSRRGRGPRFLRTDPLTVHVSSLPESRREFTGAVGRNFTLSASVDRQELAVGEALTLELRLEGDGHVASAKDPEIREAGAFRVHEAGGGVDSRPTPSGLHGVRVVQQLLIPTREGRQTIAAIEYVVFDTDREEYRTLRTQPISLSISPAEGGASATIVAGGRQSEIELLSRDIMHIYTLAPDLEPVGRPLAREPVFWVLLGAPVVMWVSSGQVSRRRRALLADPRRLRARRALHRAQTILDSDRELDVRIDGALRGYVADRSNLAAAGLRREDLSSALLKLGAADEDVIELFAILDQCDALRFARGAGDADPLLSRAKAFLDQMEAKRCG